MASQRAVVDALLQQYGRTFAAELGVRLKDTPAPLFRMLCFSLLTSAPIRAGTAMAAAKALARQGWTTAPKLADSTWRQRTDTLNRAGYARYDESTSRTLGRAADLLLEEYQGDLRNLRAQAERRLTRERSLMMAFPGIGGTGADIFFREIQAVWTEWYPFADKLSLKAAQALNLGGKPKELARQVKQRDFPVFVAALVRWHLDGRKTVV